MAVDSLFNQAEIEEEHGATEKDDSNKKMRSKKEKKNNETKIKRKRKQLLEKLMVTNDLLKILKLIKILIQNFLA